MHRITAADRRARLVQRQLRFGGRAEADPLAATRALVALHSSDPATVFLSVRARVPGFCPEHLERQLYDERTLVRVLGMRRTLFVLPLELVPVVYAACTQAIAARERRRLEKMILESGIAKRPAAWLTRACKAALAALEARGEAFTREIAADVPMLAKRLRLGAGTRFEVAQSAAARVLRQLAMEGEVMRGRPRGAWPNGEYRWVPTASWLGESLARVDPGPARAELLSKWLAAFGPATDTDIRWWTGWTAREARAALAAVPHETVDLDGAEGFVLAGDGEREDAPEPEAVLLPTLDPTTMGWKERDWYLGANESVLFDRSGNAGPTVWWGGQVVGGWAQRGDGEVVFKLLVDIGAEGVKAVEAEAQELATWLADARIRPGFLPPFQRELAT